MASELVPFNGYIARMNYRSQIGISMRHSVSPISFEVYPHLDPEKIYFDHVYRDEIERLLRIDGERYDGLYGGSYAKKRAEIGQEMIGFFQTNVDRIILSTETIPILPPEIIQLLPPSIIPYLEGIMTHLRVDGAVIRECDDQFMVGGHDLIYHWLKERPNTVITDAKMDRRDEPFQLLHEQVERILMQVLAGKIQAVTFYDVCHGMAIGVEELMRRQHGASYPGDANFNLTKEKLEKMILDLTL